jgi:hypothetical protein
MALEMGITEGNEDLLRIVTRHNYVAASNIVEGVSDNRLVTSSAGLRLNRIRPFRSIRDGGSGCFSSQSFILDGVTAV